MAGQEKPASVAGASPAEGGTAADGNRNQADHTTTEAKIQAVNFADIEDLKRQALQPTLDHRNGTKPAAEPSSRFHLLHADELDSLPPIDYMDHEREIPKRSLVVAYGASGAGKTFYVFDKSSSISQSMTVVYVAAEGVAGLAARKLAWCKHFRKRPGQLYVVGEAVNLLSPDTADFIECLRPVAPQLIVIDTLARCMPGGDENSAGSMGLFVAGCDKVRQELDATVLVIHHSGKNGLGERGSSALRAATDAMVELVNDDGLITVSCAKSKDAKPFEPRALRLLPVDTGRLTADGQPESSCVVVPAERVIMTGNVTATGRKVLDVLNMESFREAGARSSVLIEISGMKSATLYKVLSALLKEGFVRQAAKGDPFYITEAGQAVLALTLSTIKSLSVE